MLIYTGPLRRLIKNVDSLIGLGGVVFVGGEQIADGRSLRDRLQAWDRDNLGRLGAILEEEIKTRQSLVKLEPPSLPNRVLIINLSSRSWGFADVADHGLEHFVE